MANPRITPKERGLIKGSLRRVFSRSALRQLALSRNIIKHEDAKRPRVTRWGYCSNCGQVTPLYLLQIDHIDPIVRLDTTLEAMTWDEVVNRIWCEVDKLQALCKEPCHRLKTQAENKARRELKKKG